MSAIVAFDLSVLSFLELAVDSRRSLGVARNGALDCHVRPQLFHGELVVFDVGIAV